MSKWDAAQVAFEIARETESSHHRSAWLPRYESAERGDAPIPDAIEAEAERLTDVRCGGCADCHACAQSARRDLENRIRPQA